MPDEEIGPADEGLLDTIWLDLVKDALAGLRLLSLGEEAGVMGEVAEHNSGGTMADPIRPSSHRPPLTTMDVMLRQARSVDTSPCARGGAVMASKSRDKNRARGAPSGSTSPSDISIVWNRSWSIRALLSPPHSSSQSISHAEPASS